MQKGGFGVTFNDVTKDAAFYTTTSRFVTWSGPFPQERQNLWLPKDDLQDSVSWSSPPPVLLVGHSQQDGDAGCTSGNVSTH
jgi:hypothetical protein